VEKLLASTKFSFQDLKKNLKSQISEKFAIFNRC